MNIHNQLTQAKDQWLGCLYAGAIGDAVGSSFENKAFDKSTIDIWQTNWQISDDTQLTLATCESMLNQQTVDPAHIAQTFLQWFNNRKITGVGASTLKALQALQVGGHWALVGRRGEYAAGNGAAMRIAPLAFVLNPETFEDRMLIRDICRITHHHEEAYAGALAVLLAIRYFLQTNAPNRAEYFAYLANQLPDTLVRDKLELYAQEANFPSLETSKPWKASGYVAESIPLALFFASFAAEVSLDTLFHHIIAVGGDTDTNCSIAGQIIGTWLGLTGIPAPLLVKFKECVNEEIFSRVLG